MTRRRLQAWMAAAAIFAMGACAGLALAARSRAAGDLIEQVNQQVNHRLAYRSTYNDYDWTPYTRAGDCKTFVAVKRQMLIRAGVEPRRLTIWQGQDENGARHAILVVDGRRALDNRLSWTASLDDLRDLRGAGRGYRMQRCRWCEEMARWLSPLAQDADAPLPDYGYAAQLLTLHGPALSAYSGPPGTAGR